MRNDLREIRFGYRTASDPSWSADTRATAASAATEALMEIRVRLKGASEAERLKTALYRFHEVRNAVGGPSPQVHTFSDDGGLVSVVVVGSEAAAEEFRRFWAGFRSENFAERGLQDF